MRRRDLASRPMLMRGDRKDVTVKIQDITGGPGGAAAAEVTGLTREQADALPAGFNNGKTSFEGRVW